MLKVLHVNDTRFGNCGLAAKIPAEREWEDGRDADGRRASPM